MSAALPTRPTRAALGLVAGDTLVLLAFVLVGMGNHATLEAANAPVRFAVLAGALLLTWFAAATALGAWSVAPPLSWHAALGRTLAAWLIAAPLALLLLALLLGGATLIVPFMLVTLGLGGGLLLGWRSVYRWIGRRQANRR
jgi:hypothetical protein